MSHRHPGYLLVSHYHLVSKTIELELDWEAYYSSNILILFVNHEFDVLQSLFGEMKKVNATNASTENAYSELPSCTVKVISNLWIWTSKWIWKTIV